MRYYNAGRHAGCTGHALWDIAVHGHFTAESQHRLSTAVTLLGDEFVRARVMDQIRIASLVMVTGDPREAALFGGQALDVVSTNRSRCLADYLRELRRLAEPHEQLTAVAELTQRIGSAAALT